MKKEKVLKILNELNEQTKNKKPMIHLGIEDYGYLQYEHEIECFSHSSSTKENVVRVKELVEKLQKDLINTDKRFEHFIMIIEYNSQNEIMINEMEPIYDFCKLYDKEKKLCWGLNMNDCIDGIKITLIASK